MNKLTQRERILAYLRARTVATNMELVYALGIACPWKRLHECLDAQGYVYELAPDGFWRATGERITRKTVKRGDARVTEYNLTGVKR